MHRQRPTHLRCLRIASLVAVRLFLLFNLGCPPNPPTPPADTISVALVAEGLTSPVTMAIPPDNSGRRFIVDQVGTIWILDANDNLQATPFLGIADRLVPLNAAYDERGLLGMTFHPQYATNGRFFVMYNAPAGADLPVGFNSELHISEFLVSTSDQNLADPLSERILLRIAKPQANHNGGTVLFGPDGFLYISVGDGGGSNDIFPGHTPGIGNAQDLSNVLGKILRIDVDGGLPFAIPSDNPFVTTAGAAPEVWALGFRNPYRMSFDRGNGNQLFAGDAGEALFEEVDIVAAGGDYGWNIREGVSCFNTLDAISPLLDCTNVGPSGIPLTDPIITYAHLGQLGTRQGTAIVGGYVYRGSLNPALQGQYVFGDFTSTFILADGILYVASQNPDGTWQMRELQVSGTATGRINRFILGFGEDAAGELYVLTTRNGGPTGNTGEVYRIEPAQ